MQQIFVATPSFANVGAVKHVENQNILDPIVGLAPPFVHRRTGAGDQAIAGIAREASVFVDQLHLAGMHPLLHLFLEKDYRGLAIFSE